jgi:hypothetical protein
MLSCTRIALHLAFQSFLAPLLPENGGGSVRASRGLPVCSRFECTAAFVYLWEHFGSAQGQPRWQRKPRVSKSASSTALRPTADTVRHDLERKSLPGHTVITGDSFTSDIQGAQA